MAQRESYQLPEHRQSQSQQSQSNSQQQSSQQQQSSPFTQQQPSSYTYANTTRVPTDADPTQIAVTYRCGECGQPVKLFKGDVIRCDRCGHRVLYKERTKRMVQFEAR